MRVIAVSCRSVEGVQYAPLRNVSGAFWTTPACHFVSILTSLFKIHMTKSKNMNILHMIKYCKIFTCRMNILHLTRNDTHVVLLAKNEVRCTTDATRVGLEDFGLELVIF